MALDPSAIFQGAINPTALPMNATSKPGRCTLERVDAKDLKRDKLRMKPRIIQGVPEHLHWQTHRWNLEEMASREEYAAITLEAWNQKDESFLYNTLEMIDEPIALAWVRGAAPDSRNAARLIIRDWVALWRALAASKQLRIPDDTHRLFIIDGKALDLHPELRRDYVPFKAHFGRNLLREVWQLLQDASLEESLPAGIDLAMLRSFWDQMRWRYLIVGMAGSGGVMHVDPHNEGFWNVVLTGRKRWFFLSGAALGELLQKDPGIRERWNINAHEWFLNEYPIVQKSGVQFEECVLKPGEMIYGPPGWYHIVLGLENSISVSEQLVTRVNLEGYSKSVVAMVKRGSSGDQETLLKMFCLPWQMLAASEAKQAKVPHHKRLDTLAGC